MRSVLVISCYKTAWSLEKIWPSSLGVSEDTVGYWLNYSREISLEYATEIEILTKGRVDRLKLATHLSKRLRRQVQAEYEAAKNSDQH